MSRSVDDGEQVGTFQARSLRDELASLKIERRGSYGGPSRRSEGGGGRDGTASCLARGSDSVAPRPPLWRDAEVIPSLSSSRPTRWRDRGNSELDPAGPARTVVTLRQTPLS